MKDETVDTVTDFGLVSEKMAERVALDRQEEEDRWVRKEVSRFVQDDPGEEEDMEDVSWSWWNGHRLTTRRRRRTCLDYCLDYCLINCVEHGLCFRINIVEP